MCRGRPPQLLRHGWRLEAVGRRGSASLSDEASRPQRDTRIDVSGSAAVRRSLAADAAGEQAALTSAVAACAGRSDWVFALSLLDRCKRNSVQAHLPSCNAALSACERAHRWQLVVAVFQESFGTLSPAALSSSTLGVVMSAYQRASRWQAALALLMVSSAAGAGSPWPAEAPGCGEVLVNTAVGACARAQRWAEAMDLLHGRDGCHRTSDVVGYSAAVGACSGARQWQQALALLDKMVQQTVSPDAVTYGALVVGLTSAAAIAALQRLPRQLRRRLWEQLWMLRSAGPAERRSRAAGLVTEFLWQLALATGGEPLPARGHSALCRAFQRPLLSRLAAAPALDRAPAAGLS
eukprot:TRINITY_DN47460_c0_g1_i2.p1 TRINITY_DN47460_c0_g1~~TRINITY_DN47460_c0_g1_i2.p1  ORF type:complete len:351 (-),score=47.83 TRINITY_DN47460_c0_g1_i2:26-1078(-)